MQPFRAVATSLPLIAGVTALALASPDVSGWKTYYNVKTGVEFRYPPDSLLKELATPDGRPIAMLIRDADGGPTDWLFDVSVEELPEAKEPVRPDGGAAALRFATDVAKLHCDADGPDASVSCPDLLKSQRFTNPHGLAAFELYLAEVVGSNVGGQTKIERRTKGPIYAVDISTEAAIRVLLFELTERGLTRGRREILRAIVDSVRLIKGS